MYVCIFLLNVGAHLQKSHIPRPQWHITLSFCTIFFPEINFLQSIHGHFDVCLHFPFVLSEFPLYKPYKPTLPRHTSNPIAPTATNTNPIPAAFFLFSITTNCLLSMEFNG